MTRAKLIVAVHLLSGEDCTNHALRETEKVIDAGADGVLLIPDYAKQGDESDRYSRCTFQELLAAHSACKKAFPKFPCGVNSLSGINLREIQSQTPLDFLQTDGSEALRIAKDLGTTLALQYFAGVAFKYSLEEKLLGDKLRAACERFRGSVGVVPTTSGARTGVAASQEKIETLKSALLTMRIMNLGIASGVTLANALELKRLGVTHFIVATDLIERTDALRQDVLSYERVRVMSTLLHDH